MKDVYHANIVRDSVYIETYAKNDTIYRDRWHRTIINDTVLKHDTLYVSKVDTIKVPVPVEKKQGWWEKSVTKVKDYIVTTILVAVIALLLMWYIKKRNN